MPWCPKCKNEYRDGVTVCADCGCELVDSLEEVEKVKLYFGEEEQLKAMKEFLEYNGVEGIGLRFDEDEEVWELLVREENRKKASRMVNVFLQQEEEKRTGEAEPEQEDDEAQTVQVSAGMYQDSAERAEDNRSSAWTLLVVGGAGLLVMILGLAGVLPIHLTGTNKYMVYGIMSALFILFIVMGFVSMKNSRVFAKKAESENSLRDALSRWCQENLTKESIDGELALLQDTSEEVLYFKRFEKMKEKLGRQFVNLDEAFLEHFIDEQYDAVFGGRKDVQ